MTEVYPDLLLVYRDKTAGSDVRYVQKSAGIAVRFLRMPAEVKSGMSKEPGKSAGMFKNLRCFI
jgi:hypothetical protein